jgi:large subunit ribosomal protein L25
MKTFELKGEIRKDIGKVASKKLRKIGKIPCVIYGGKENIHFSVELPNLKKLIYTPHVYLVDLEIGKKKYNAIIKDMQFHAVSDEISHLDFLEIHDDKPVEISVPVELTGVSPGVKAGGKLHLVNRKLRVKGLSKDFPDNLVLDISDLELGKSIKVADLSYENFTILNPKNTVIASVKLTRASKAEEEEKVADETPVEGAIATTEKKKAE